MLIGSFAWIPVSSVSLILSVTMEYLPNGICCVRVDDSDTDIAMLMVDVFGCGGVGGGNSCIVDESDDAIDMFTDDAIELGELPVDDSDDSTLSIITPSLMVTIFGDTL
jgi:hypothetical protein